MSTSRPPHRAPRSGSPSIAIWIDGGLGWSRLRTATTQNRIDFTAPGALEGWHYAVGMRSGGIPGIASLAARSRASHE